MKLWLATRLYVASGFDDATNIRAAPARPIIRAITAVSPVRSAFTSPLAFTCATSGLFELYCAKCVTSRTEPSE